MPLTFAHPVASIPLYRPLKHFGVLSALVIGSISPDFVYFLPIKISRLESHSIGGLFWFCLPLGLLSYWVYHVFLKGSLLALLPEYVFSRLGDYVERYKTLPQTSWLAVIISLLCGAITHLVWDAFTHQEGFAVKNLRVLKSQLFFIGDYPVYLYKVLQHMSTLFGLIIMGIWIWRWLKNHPVNECLLPKMLTRTHRYLIMAALCFVPTIYGLWMGYSALISHQYGHQLKIFAGNAVFSALPISLFCLILYGICWNISILRMRS